jgi:dTMP kinase
MGVFVVFEGVEGSGKTTQSRELERRIASTRRSVTRVHEPGGTPIADSISRLLKGAYDIGPLDELLLFSAARASVVTSVIRPTLKHGGAVVCDRYIYSTLAYQGYGRGISLDTVRKLNDIATETLEPDLIVLLDLEPGQGLGRIADRPLDRIEQERHEFHKRVREGYLELASDDPERWLVLDGSLSAEPLSDSVWSRVSEMLSA